MPLQTAVFGVAWWTVFREKRSARAWGIAASMVFILWVLLPLITPPHFFWTGDLLLLGVGTTGLIVFAWPRQRAETVQQPPKTWKLPSDGTSTLFNSAVQLVMMLVCWRAYHWWMEWLENNGLPSPGFIRGTLELALIGLLIVFLHESGHTLVGVLVGMKLRAFIVGPFQMAHSRREMGIPLRTEATSRNLGRNRSRSDECRFSPPVAAVHAACRCSHKHVHWRLGFGVFAFCHGAHASSRANGAIWRI